MSNWEVWRYTGKGITMSHDQDQKRAVRGKSSEASGVLSQDRECAEGEGGE